MGFFTPEKEKLLSKLIDAADTALLYLNTKGDIVLSNKKVGDITGRTAQELLGRNWLDILYRGSGSQIKQQTFKAVMEDSVTYKRPNSFEAVVGDTGGSRHFILWGITPVSDGSGRLEGVLLVGNDITLLKERRASFEKIDETLKGIFSNIKEYAIYVANLDGNITYYGMGSELMFGWKKQEIIFKHVSVLHNPADAKLKIPLMLEEASKHGRSEAEIELVRKDGQSIPVALTVNPFLDAEYKLAGYIFIAKDITERKKLEYQIFQSEKMAAIGQLSAGMAHEINNPLFVISGRLELLSKEKKLPRKVKETLAIVTTQADRIRNLVERMLKFSRRAPTKTEVIDINKAITAVLPLISYHHLSVTGIKIKKELSGRPLLIKGDTGQLQEVFLNLFINAYEAMPHGGVLSIKTSALADGRAQAVVSDSGCGIPEESLKNIFIPFFSTKEKGTGLGLSICYNIIKNHNGSIDIESRPQRGTTFTIRLPLEAKRRAPSKKRRS